MRAECSCVMKFILILILSFFIVGCAQQRGYELEAWFWHNHLSTRDSLYTQDVDVKSQNEVITVHLSIADFDYLDSIATSIGFWTLPDSIYDPSDTLWRNRRMKREAGFSGRSSERISFEFQTPRHHKLVENIFWYKTGHLLDNIDKLEVAILTVHERQPQYKTLPHVMFHD